ncbi:hypothetical protein GCM10025877_22830 [Agromyces mangrovi Wang et al. 2018]|nr:hypothetical protein GCM10025877_22830 [Agromyces mangrovi]
MPEWNFSAPAADCRHWKKRMPSAPRPTHWYDQARICPGALGALRARQFTALGACSMSSHGLPPPSERMRSRTIAAYAGERGSAGSGYVSSETTSTSGAHFQ